MKEVIYLLDCQGGIPDQLPILNLGSPTSCSWVAHWLKDPHLAMTLRNVKSLGQKLTGRVKQDSACSIHWLNLSVTVTYSPQLEDLKHIINELQPMLEKDDYLKVSFGDKPVLA